MPTKGKASLRAGAFPDPALPEDGHPVSAAREAISGPIIKPDHAVRAGVVGVKEPQLP